MNQAGNDGAVSCPICGQAGRLIRRTEFSQRASLPTQVGVYICSICSFGFNFPRPKSAYERYYGHYQNDQLSQNWQISESEHKRYQDQIAVLRPYLLSDQMLRVLDFGCGQGGLLHTMALSYGQHRYFGCDANAHTQLRDDGVSIHRDLDELSGPFDVIVLSHVVEHLIDFDILERISELLTPTGVVYMEVPDAGAYEHYQRREFLYYFDRLHVNHFTFQSLVKIANTYGLAPWNLGVQRFGYKDGNLFPAIYAILSRQVSTTVCPTVLDLNASFCRYIEAEYARLKPIHKALRRGRGVVACGCGDNFFRLFGQNGPLEDIPLLAVVDQRGAELAAEDGSLSRFRFLDRETASALFPNAMWIITVSWGGEGIADKLKKLGVLSSSILLL